MQNVSLKNLWAQPRPAAPRMDESGMTLVEVSIVAGIMMVLALGFATMMSNVGNQQRAIEVKGNINQLSMGVRGTASTPTSLQNSLSVVD